MSRVTIMSEDHLQDVHPTSGWRLRAAVIALLVLVVAAGHWWTPRGDGGFLALHVLLRKLFLVPVLLAGIWFNVPGALSAAAAVTVLYAPHVILQWAGEAGENINQVGEVVTVWVTAGLAGVLVRREKSALLARTKAYHGTVRALVAALDAREHDTGRHSERVCAYAVRIGREMGLAPTALRSLALGALLHDIGKIGVPDAILLKPGKLSEEEWSCMREHPEQGARILNSTPFLREAVQVVRFHHERVDGAGYPCGLSGDRIPLAARIFAVADVYDALTSRRPYRQPLSHSEALYHIKRGAGTQFDPQVVASFARIPVAEWVRAVEPGGSPGERSEG
jgi:putative nucleotidyltransferase with HDIG domain